MSKLITYEDAIQTLASNGKLQFKTIKGEWLDLTLEDLFAGAELREKPRTIMINGVEVPAPFEPKDGEVFSLIASSQEKGFLSSNCLKHATIGAWRTEDDIKQVVAALRAIFSPN